MLLKAKEQHSRGSYPNILMVMKGSVLELKACKGMAVLLLLTFFLQAAIVNKAGSQYGENTIFISPTSIVDSNKTAGSAITVGLNISYVEMLHSWQAKIRYNPALLYTNSSLIQEGAFLKDSIRQTTFHTYLDADYLFIACSISGIDWQDGGSAENGYLATITFIILRLGETRLEIMSDPADRQQTKLLNVDGDEIPHTSENGYFRNTVSAAPTASFAYRPAFPLWNENTTFNASLSSDPDGIDLYIWFFGDMNTTTQKENTANVTTPITYHSYIRTTIESSKSFTVRLIVIDKAQMTGNLSAQLLTVVSSRLPVDLAVTSAYPTNKVVEPSGTLRVKVVVLNNGTSPATFNATAYLDSTAIGTYTNTTLDASFTCILDFSWNVPVDQPLGFYRLSAEVSEVINETDVNNNVYVYPDYVIISYYPHVSFTYEPLTPYVDEQIMFNASRSYAPMGTIHNYTWDFGEWIYSHSYVEPTVTTDPTVMHGYAIGGKYFVTLTLTDNMGVRNSTSQWVEILKYPSTITLTPPSTATVGLNTSIGGSIAPPQSPTKVAVFYRSFEDETWQSLANVTTDTEGSFSSIWKPNEAGAFEFKANWTGNARYERCESNVIMVAAKLTSHLSLHANLLSVTLGENVTLNGSISPSRLGANVTILYRLGEGSWSVLTNVTTLQDGNFECAWKPAADGVYDIKALWEGDETTHGDESDLLRIEVHPSGAFGPFGYWYVAVAAIAIVAIAFFLLVLRKREKKMS